MLNDIFLTLLLAYSGVMFMIGGKKGTGKKSTGKKNTVIKVQEKKVQVKKVPVKKVHKTAWIGKKRY